MSEKLSQTIEKFKNNPLDVIKEFSQEQQALKAEVMKSSTLMVNFAEHLKKTYPVEQLNKITKWWDVVQYLHTKIMSLSSKDLVNCTWVSWLKDVTNMIDVVGSLFGDEDPQLNTTIAEFVWLRKEKPLDITKIESWMTEQWIVSTTTDTITPSNHPGSDTPPEVSPTNVVAPIVGSIVPEVVDTPVWLDKVMSLAKSQIGVNEKDNSADKYFRELWYKHDSKKVPWCGAFVSRTLMKSWFPSPKNDLSAKSFINESGAWHVGIKVDGKIISWNYGNKVSSGMINKPIKWYAIPTKNWLEIHKETLSFDKIPEGAIVVFDRTSKRTQAA